MNWTETPKGRPASGMTRLISLIPLIPLPEGTRVRYTYRAPEGTVVVEGVKGRPLGMSRLGNQGYVITADDGTEHKVTRYAMVEVVR